MLDPAVESDSLIARLGERVSVFATRVESQKQREPMKVQSKNLLIAAVLLGLGWGGLNAAAPETMELDGLKVTNLVKPQVPYEMTRYGIRGSVDVTFEIDEEGIPQNIEVEQSTNYRYAESVVTALSQWRFEPLEDGYQKYRLPVIFN